MVQRLTIESAGGHPISGLINADTRDLNSWTMGFGHIVDEFAILRFPHLHDRLGAYCDELVGLFVEKHLQNKR